MRSSEVAHPGPTTPGLLYWVARLWMGLLGWDVEGEPPQVRKAVVIAAPHTTNWDLPHMLAASLIFRFKISWLGKESLFRAPLGWLLRPLGGVAVDRSSPHGLVEEVAQTLRSADRLAIAVPPSGTRSRREYWKSGFYWIAHSAQVPVVCGYLDYSKKRAGLGFSFVPTGDIQADMARIREFYSGIHGKYPALENPIRTREEYELLKGPQHAGEAEGGRGDGAP